MSATKLKYPNVSLRLADLETPVLDRGDQPAGIIRRDLRRYYANLADELNVLAFSVDEARLLVEATRNAGLDEQSVRFLAAHVEGVINRMDVVDEVLQRHQRTLLAKLKTASRSQLLAIWDAVERYWKRDDDGTRLYHVGLVRGSVTTAQTIDPDFARQLNRFMEQYGPALQALAHR